MTALESASLVIHLPIVLRVGEQTDLPKLEWYGQYTHQRKLFRRAFREQQLGRRLILVADLNNFPIGQVFIQFVSTDAMIADGNKRAYLYSLRVMEMFRGYGIGTRLILEAETMIADRGFEWISIAVGKENHPAWLLYERLGYEIFGEDPGRWSYLDHQGRARQVQEPCWLLHKQIAMG